MKKSFLQGENEMKKLTDVCSIVYGYAFNSKRFKIDNGTPVIRIRDVVRGFTETFTDEDVPEEYHVKNGDLLIGMDGEFNIGTWKGGHAFLNQRVCKVIPNENASDRYVYHYLPHILKDIEANTTFVTVKHLSAKQLNAIPFPDISLAEQQKIAAELDTIQSAIDNKKQQLALLDEAVKSEFVEMFGDFSECSKIKWEIKSFTEVAKIDGNMVNDFTKYADYPHIGIDSIEKNTGELKGYRTVKEDNVISGKYLFTPEHIIYSKIRPNLNKVALPTFHGVCSADAYPILVDKSKCNRYYLAYLMRSDYFLTYILAFASRAGMPKVNREQVNGFKLPVPPLSLQNQFAAFVQQIDKSKSLVKQQITDLQELLDSKMQEYFA